MPFARLIFSIVNVRNLILAAVIASCIYLSFLPLQDRKVHTAISATTPETCQGSSVSQESIQKYEAFAERYRSLAADYARLSEKVVQSSNERDRLATRLEQVHNSLTETIANSMGQFDVLAHEVSAVKAIVARVTAAAKTLEDSNSCPNPFIAPTLDVRSLPVVQELIRRIETAQQSFDSLRKDLEATKQESALRSSSLAQLENSLHSLHGQLTVKTSTGTVDVDIEGLQRQVLQSGQQLWSDRSAAVADLRTQLETLDHLQSQHAQQLQNLHQEYQHKVQEQQSQWKQQQEQWEHQQEQFQQQQHQSKLTLSHLHEIVTPTVTTAVREAMSDEQDRLLQHIQDERVKMAEELAAMPMPTTHTSTPRTHAKKPQNHRHHHHSSSSSSSSNHPQSVFHPSDEYHSWYNFASLEAGAQVLDTLSAPTFIPLVGAMGIPLDGPVSRTLGEHLWLGGGSPAEALSPRVSRGSCWPMLGGRGDLTVQLAHDIVVKAITIDHYRGPDGDHRSAPRVFGVDVAEWTTSAVDPDSENDAESGSGSEPSLHWRTAISRAEFEAAEQSSMTFPVDQEVAGRVVRLQVESNHDHPEFTCIYGFRVHGIPVDRHAHA